MYKKVECVGGPCFYVEYGEENRDTILFLHGYSDSAKTFEPLKDYLSPKYRVLIPDLPMINEKVLATTFRGCLHLLMKL